MRHSEALLLIGRRIITLSRGVEKKRLKKSSTVSAIFLRKGETNERKYFQEKNYKGT